RDVLAGPPGDGGSLIQVLRHIGETEEIILEPHHRASTIRQADESRPHTTFSVLFHPQCMAASRVVDRHASAFRLEDQNGDALDYFIGQRLLQPEDHWP